VLSNRQNFNGHLIFFWYNGFVKEGRDYLRILIAEDERDLNHLLAKRLRSAGYAVDTCFDGSQALDYLTSADYDAAIMDILMPGMDGLEVLRRLRAEGCSTPVLLLTARDSVSDRVRGLDAGANDYLVKPFSFEELMARVRVLLRRENSAHTNVFSLANLTLDCNRHSVERGGVPITLSAKEFALLEYMLRNQGTVLSRTQIENHVWDYDYEGGTNVVDVYIRYLRKKIDEGHDVKLIHTVRGRGYVLQEDNKA